MGPDTGDVLRLGRLLGAVAHEPLERRRHVIELLLAGPLLPPRGERPTLVHGRVVPRHRAHEIPAHVPVALREREAGELRSCGQTDLRGGHRDPHPFTRLGQRPRMEALRRSHLAEVDRRRVAPHGPVLPGVGVELEHDGPGWSGGIEPDMREQLRSRTQHQRLGAARVEVLPDPLGRPLEAALARLHATRRIRDEPRGLGSGGLHGGIRGELVVEPDGLADDGLGLWIECRGVRVRDPGHELVHGRPQARQAGVEVGDLPLLVGRRQLDRRCGRRDVAVEARIGGRVEEGVERIELPGRERIELVIVADGALPRETQPHVGERGRAIDRIAEEELVVDRAPLARRDVAPREAGGRPLVARGVRQEVARDLLDGEPVEGHVGVEGAHDPVAVGPHLPLVVEMEAVRVGVAGGIEPVPGHLLAVMRAREQPIDELLVGVGRRVGGEDRDLVPRGRQAGERERRATDERGPVGLAVPRQPLGREPRLEKAVDRRGRRIARRHLRPHERLERPVLLVDRTGGDPPLEQVFLRVGERLLRVRRRHHDVGIGGTNPRGQSARRRVAGHHRPPAAFERAGRRLSGVESEPRLLRAGSMACVAIFGEDRPDVAVEPQGSVGPGEADDEGTDHEERDAPDQRPIRRNRRRHDTRLPAGGADGRHRYGRPTTPKYTPGMTQPYCRGISLSPPRLPPRPES